MINANASKNGNYDLHDRIHNGYKKYTDQIEKLKQKEKTKSTLQYFKDEKFLTLYGLESLNYSNMINLKNYNPAPFHRLLDLAYPGMSISNSIQAIPIINYELDVPECLEFREHLSKKYHNQDTNCKKIYHPVKYVREAGKLKKENARYEGPTQMDAVIEFPLSGNKIFVESKFMSDISYNVRYSPVRNQVARCIEAGLQKVGYKIKKFWFMLISPSIYKNEHPDSRLYSHILREYQNSPSKLKHDLPHLDGKVDYVELSDHIAHMCWEDIKVLCENYSNVTTEHKKLLQDFWADRSIF